MQLAKKQEREERVALNMKARRIEEKAKYLQMNEKMAAIDEKVENAKKERNLKFLV